MAIQTLKPCPKCGGEITIRQASGGRGTGNLTDYSAHCSCGFETDCLGTDGTKRSAISDWNKLDRNVALDMAEGYKRRSGTGRYF